MLTNNRKYINTKKPLQQMTFIKNININTKISI